MEKDVDYATHHQRALCEGLWNLRSEGTMCDVVLDVCGERLLAHGVILSACSPYLKTHCTHNDTNPKDRLTEIKIPNCSYKVCLKTLEHLYTGKAVVLSGSLLEEFDNLCGEWQLKQPLVAPFNNISDLKTSNEVESVPSPSISDPSEENDGSESEEKGKSVLSGEIQNRTPTPEPKEFVGRKTRLTQKRTAAPKSAGGKPPKRRKCATSKKAVTNNTVKEEEKTKEEPEKITAAQSNSISDENSNLTDDAESSNDNDSSWESDSKSKKTLNRSQRKTLPTKTPKVKAEKKAPTGRPRGRPKKCGQGPHLYSNNAKKGRAFVCRQCQMEFSRRAELTQHRKEHHRDGLGCDACNMQFPERNQLLAHNVEHHWTEGMELPEIYSCQVAGCNFNTHKRMSWYNHRLHAHPSECSICDICGKSLKNELTLRQHKAVVHPTSPRKVFACPSCDKVFKTESGMQKHKDVAHRPWTSEREKFVCPYCAHTCMLSESLTEHLYKKHDILPASKKSYKCKHCDFKTTHIAEIKKHEIRHKPETEKPFHCDKCDKRFVDKGSLVSHQLKHDVAANRFNCPHCDYSTKYTHNLRAHIQVRHENKDYKPWECDECSYRCNSKGNLYKHLRNVHKRTVETKYMVARVGDQQPPDAPPPSGTKPAMTTKTPAGVVTEDISRGWEHVSGNNPEPAQDTGLWTLQVDHSEGPQCQPTPMPTMPGKLQQAPVTPQYEFIQHHHQHQHHQQQQQHQQHNQQQQQQDQQQQPIRPVTTQEQAQGHHHSPHPPPPSLPPPPPPPQQQQQQQQVHIPQNVDMNLLYTYPGF